MANQQVKIVVSAEDKASAELKKVNGELKKVGDEGKSAGEKIKQSWTELNSKFSLIEGKIKQVWQAIKQTYEIAREGADLEFMASKFDNLTASIGTTSEALLRDLRGATDGTLSDMELMASATDFLSLGLANSHDEVVRLSTVSSQLGMDMNQLVLTLTNQTTMRFDALGVSVAGFDEKVQTLKDSGMDANAAFTEAFLQQAEQQIERVGSATEESIGSFMRLEAAWKNATDTAKRQLVPTFEKVAESFANMLNVIPDNVDQLENLNDQLEEGEISYDDYKTAVDEVLDALHLEYDEQGNLIAIRRGAEDGLEALADTTIYYSEEALKAAQETEKWTEHEKKLADQFKYTSTPAIEAGKDATNNANEAMKKYSETLLFNIAAQGLTDEQALELAYAMGLVDENTVMATEKTKLYKEWLDKKYITEEQYYELILNVNKAIEDTPTSKTFDLWVNIHGLEGIETLTSMGGGGSSGGGFEVRAAGGPVRPGQTVVVGESGPEILQMGQNGGHIYPTNVTNNFNLGVTTLQNANSIQTAFAIMQAMA